MINFFDKAQRKPYEKIILLLVTALLIFLVWLFLLVMPIAQQTSNTTNKIDIANKNLQALIYDYQNYQLINDQPTEVIEKKLLDLTQQLNALQKHPLLAKKMVNNQQDMKQFLQTLSQTGPLLSLKQLQTLTPSNEKSVFSKQPISIEFYGGYFATLHYLEYLENSPWALTFDSIDYQVEQYPNAKVKIMLHAISNSAGA